MINQKDNRTQLINDQDRKEHFAIPFGTKGNVGNNGCAAIAIHNMNILLNLNSTLPLQRKQIESTRINENSEFQKILNRFNVKKRGIYRPVFMQGKMGGNPLFIKKYYRDKGYDARWKSIKKCRTDADAYIILVVYKHLVKRIFPLGAHYQAGVMSHGKLEVFNPNGHYQSFKEYFEAEKCNIGIRVLEIRAKNGKR